MSNIFLQIFLYLNVFVIGSLATLAVQHARAHIRLKQVQPIKAHAPVTDVHLPVALRKQLIETAAANFQIILDKAAADLEHDLKETSLDLNGKLGKLGTDTVGSEMERYKVELTELRKQALTTLDGAMAGIADQEIGMKAQLAQDIASEKQRLITQIDTKLADAVASFLVDALQHNVDLGAQGPYLTSLLEQHKAEFSRGISDEA